MISIYLNGRLGNQLFQYIKIRIEADIHKCNFYIPSSSEESISLYSDCSRKFSRYFELPVDGNPHYWTGSNLFQIDYGINDGVLNKIINECEMSIADGSFLCGFYQTDYNFSNKQDFVKDILKFNSEIETQSSFFVKKYPTEEFCYIHFRGGDYKKINNWYLPKKYYDDAIEYVRMKFKIKKFIVITDDHKEAKSVFPDLEVLSNTQELDFYLIHKSKYTIIPNSSFSWWAAWLKDYNYVTVAPKGWFNYKSGGDFEPVGINTNKFTYI
jgi:hypothetical protein